MANNENKEDTDTQFELMLSQLLNNNYTPGRLSQICSSFKKKDYDTALRFFTETLRSRSKNDTDIQLGIAFCHLKLGKTDRAKSVFESIISLNPLCTTALISLAALRLGSERPNKIQLGINIVSKVSIIDDNNPSVLFNMANNFLSKYDYDNAEFFVKLAIENALNSNMKAEICYHTAKMYHMQVPTQYRFLLLSMPNVRTT